MRPAHEISSVASTREALYLAASVAVSPTRAGALALMPNPFYQTYRVAAIMAGAEPHYLSHSGFPEFAIDLDGVDEAVLARTSILYLCSPSNPEGQVMPPIHLAPEDVQLELAVFRGERPRRHLLHQLLAPVAVFDELRDGDERQPVALLELDQLGQPGHRAVLV